MYTTDCSASVEPVLVFCDRNGRLTGERRPSSHEPIQSATLLEWARPEDQPTVRRLLDQATERGTATANLTDSTGPAHIWAVQAFSVSAGSLLLSMIPTGRHYQVWQTTPRRRLLLSTECEDTARVFQRSFDKHAAKRGVPNRSEII